MIKYIALYFINQNSINLNLQCFTRENLIDFSNFLYKKFNIEFIVKKDKTLYLRYNSRKTFLNLIEKYLSPDMIYKIEVLKSSLNLVNLGKSGSR